MNRFDFSLLLPSPKRIHTTENALDIRNVATIRFQGEVLDPMAFHILQEHAKELIKECYMNPDRDTGIEFRIHNNASSLCSQNRESGGGVPIRFVLDRNCLVTYDEAYRLEVRENEVLITGKNEPALYLGLQTLRQCIELAKGDYLIPGCIIEDWPSFPFRCYSDDISRRQISTMKDFEYIIQNLSHMKYNYYQPYIEDVIAIDKHPLVGLHRGRLTRDEVSWLVEYGKRHFIEIIPQFNSLSHQEHLLSIPNYAHFSRHGNLENFDPENPDVRSYTVIYNNRKKQKITIRSVSDIGDWWMPYGHVFGGGGALKTALVSGGIQTVSNAHGKQPFRKVDAKMKGVFN